MCELLEFKELLAQNAWVEMEWTVGRWALGQGRGEELVVRWRLSGGGRGDMADGE